MTSRIAHVALVISGLLIGGCSMPQLTPMGRGVIALGTPPAGHCQALGMVIGNGRGPYSPQSLVEYATNEARNHAAELGATHVVTTAPALEYSALYAHNGEEVNTATLTGSAYRCVGGSEANAATPNSGVSQQLQAAIRAHDFRLYELLYTRYREGVGQDYIDAWASDLAAFPLERGRAIRESTALREDAQLRAANDSRLLLVALDQAQRRFLELFPSNPASAGVRHANEQTAAEMQRARRFVEYNRCAVACLVQSVTALRANSFGATDGCFGDARCYNRISSAFDRCSSACVRLAPSAGSLDPPATRLEPRVADNGPGHLTEQQVIARVRALPAVRRFARSVHRPGRFSILVEGSPAPGCVAGDDDCQWSLGVGGNGPERWSRWNSFYVDAATGGIRVLDILVGDRGTWVPVGDFFDRHGRRRQESNNQEAPAEGPGETPAPTEPRPLPSVGASATATGGTPPREPPRETMAPSTLPEVPRPAARATTVGSLSAGASVTSTAGRPPRELLRENTPPLTLPEVPPPAASARERPSTTGPVTLGVPDRGGSTDSSDGHNGVGVGPWIVGGLGVVALGTAAVSWWVVRAGAQSDRDAACHAASMSCDPSAQDAQRRGEAATLVTNVSLGVGAAGLVGGTLWLIFGRGATREPAATAWTVGADPVAGGGVARISGSF